MSTTTQQEEKDLLPLEYSTMKENLADLVDLIAGNSPVISQINNHLFSTGLIPEAVHHSVTVETAGLSPYDRANKMFSSVLATLKCHSDPNSMFSSLITALKRIELNDIASKLMENLRKKGGHVDPNLEQQTSVSEGPLQPVDVTAQSPKPQQPTITESQSSTPPTVTNYSRVATCTCILVLVLILTLAGVGVGISIRISCHSSISLNQSMEISDKQSSSALIPVPNNVSSVLLKSLNTQDPFEVTVFIASSIPPNGTQRLNETYSHVTRCTPYNVNTGDNPVYLLSGSIMNYTLTVSGLNDSKCMAQLVVYNKSSEYLACKHNSSNVVKAYCLSNDTVNHVSVMINKSAEYYVRLITDDPTISVITNITVYQVHYNTSHLITANDCEQISNDDSCTVHNDNVKQWSCSNTEWYVILQSSSNVEVEYNYKTPSHDYCALRNYLIGYCLGTQRGKIMTKCKKNRTRGN
ncbi:PREDICTED: uncharacterized protein LOC109585053 isoform X2 [Amphimedon queenslandica]|uniref:Death domain-containing protein n=1 Tax=Amphimedon queenslandica TaxID=400682 RepID=A0AAN0JHN1_AMPQE|nr:PREDICTED: uncharacterized protein LOC109585053 isoform X2 [Amphimedon queenslandica]|eukprot:XP_019856545.1 PREDICTED: uncharacterized protein LOC109585053 isoform X2 [Amphimedon queenslandica]